MGTQYTMPARTCWTFTSGTIGRSQSAISCMPDSSDMLWPMMIQPLGTPSVAASMTYSGLSNVPSISRCSPPIHVCRVDRRRRHARARRDAADLRARIPDDPDGVVAADLLYSRGELSEGRLGNEEPVGVRRRFRHGIEADLARGAREREVRPLPVHMIVDPEDRDVVLRHEVDFRLVDQGVGFRDQRVVRIVPVRVLVRDDHVEAERAGLRDRLERTHEGRGDAGDDRVGSAELEPVTRRPVTPLDALDGHYGLDAVDDLAGSKHQSGLQYGSPAEMNRIGTSATIVFSQSAQTCIPGASLTTRPIETKPFLRPANTTSCT